MKLNLRIVNYVWLAGVSMVLLASCGKSDPNSPGVEYMPDMYRSPAIEPYVDYVNSSVQSARLPVEGTIVFTENESEEFYNYPYPYKNSFSDYDLAGENLVSPIAFNEASVADGKVIYERFCIQCHGKTGQGDGAVPTNSDYPNPPSYSTSLKDLPVGKMYHTITYGKGMMGSHASQLTPKERWTVIQYVMYLQNGGSMTKPSAEETEGEG
jgi:mono/diheme cytochrome c family protein